MTSRVFCKFLTQSAVQFDNKYKIFNSGVYEFNYQSTKNALNESQILGTKKMRITLKIERKDEQRSLSLTKVKCLQQAGFKYDAVLQHEKLFTGGISTCWQVFGASCNLLARIVAY